MTELPRTMFLLRYRDKVVLFYVINILVLNKFKMSFDTSPSNFLFIIYHYYSLSFQLFLSVITVDPTSFYRAKII